MISAFGLAEVNQLSGNRCPKRYKEAFSVYVWVTLCVLNITITSIYSAGHLFPFFLPVTPQGNIPEIKHL